MAVGYACQGLWKWGALGCLSLTCDERERERENVTEPQCMIGSDEERSVKFTEGEFDMKF